MHFLLRTHKLKLLPLIVIQMCLITSMAMGQSGTVSVSGKVTDETGQGLPGATVQIEGTAQGTITDAEGNYKISTPSSATLNVSFIGFANQRIAVAGRSIIDIQLESDAEELAEIVVVGYGSQKRSDLTGSVASIGADAIDEMPVNSVDQALQGRVAGLNVVNTSGMPGAGVSIRIRGSGSLIGSSEPLYVVDGVPYYNDNAEASPGTLQGDQSNSESLVENFNVMASLNPNDIKSIEVLKDASATAIYGSRGANGVIIITTKNGTGESRGKIRYNSWAGFAEMTNQPEMMKSREYAEFRNQQFIAVTPDFDPVADRDQLPFPGMEVPTSDGEGTFYRNGPEDFDFSTDWLDEISRTGVTQSHNVSFSGANKGTNIFISGEYFTQDGVLLKSGMDRISGRVNLGHTFTPKVTARANVFYSQIQSTNQPTATSEQATNTGAIFRALITAPTDRVRNPDGSFFQSDDPTADPSLQFVSPIAQIEGTDILQQISQFNSTFSLDYQIIDGLKFTTRLGYLLYSSNRSAFYGAGSWLGNNTNGSAVKSSNVNRKPNWDNFVNYTKTIGKHNVNVTAGYSWEQGLREAQRASSRDFAVPVLGFDAVQAGAVIGVPFSDRNEFTLTSYYMRANYTFNNKYLLTFTSRADGSSRFAENNKWGFFPSFAVAWRASEEAFIQDIRQITDLKVRASYGETGNQAISPYQSLATLGFFNYNQDGQLATGVAPASLANPNLSWETTAQLNFGFDLGVLDNRLRFTVDYYKKNTRDLLWNINLPSNTGFNQALSNLGEIENSGFEFTLQSDVIDRGDFGVSMNFNISTNRNEVLDLGRETELIGPNLSTNGVPFPVHLIRVGEPLNSFWVYETDGYLSQEDIDSGYPIFAAQRAGDIKYVDQNGDGVFTDEDKKIFGNPQPDFNWGIGLNAFYKSFGLDVLFSGVQGVDVYNVNNQLTSLAYRPFLNKVEGFLENSWTPDNPNAKYPTIASVVDPVPSDRYVEDASFARLANVKLSYDFGRMIESTPWLSELQLYVTARNLLTFTDYSGFDPEVSAYGQSPRRPMVDFGGYPQIRSYIVGLNIGF